MKIIKADLRQQQHAKDYVKLMSLYACDPMGGGQDLSQSVKENLPAALASRPNIVVFLAYTEAEQPVGLATAIEGFSTFACKPLLNIHDVIVDPHFRGQNIAGSLLSAVQEEAQLRGCCKLTLEVLQKNAPAQKAYRHFGFAPYGLDPTMGTAEFWEKTL